MSMSSAYDRAAMAALLDWTQRALDGKARQRQLIIAQQVDRVSVTLRYGERYVITITRGCLAEAASAALQAATKEDDAAVDKQREVG